ncbi:MAG: class I SAM-dependent methyltransferase [Acidimicrobiia bacterium]|nr:class I SAM-dependent methyltransferase [Acidimicrobiia bacterium]
MDSYRADTYGEAFADVYDRWYDGVSDIDGTVATIGRLANGRPVLELGVGTGRLALPLAAEGVPVSGIDASPSMIERLRAKPGGADIHVVVGDMAVLDDIEVSSYAVVFAAFNTFFNLPTEATQAACLARVHDVLVPDGRLAIEAFLPSPEPAAPEGRLEVRGVEIDRVLLTATWRDPHTNIVAGQHLELSADGIRLRPWLLRYSTPDSLDALASRAGFDLESRHAGWRGEPFDPDGGRHVSIYRRTTIP